jgi:hypothetical protein
VARLARVGLRIGDQPRYGDDYGVSEWGAHASRLSRAIWRNQFARSKIRHRLSPHSRDLNIHHGPSFLPSHPHRPPV